MNTRNAIEGGWLTQATLTDENSRTFVKVVSSYGNIDNWRDATQAEKEQWESEHQPSEEDNTPSLEDRVADLESKASLAEALI